MRPSLALLIDGDQVPAEGIPPLIERLSKDWTVDERVCVRNWRSTKDQQAWRAIAGDEGIRLIQRDPARVGKNASDIELAVIAMDLLHQGRKAFCLVSGDTDFTPVIERMRRASAHIEVVEPKSLSGTKRPQSRRGRARSAERTPSSRPSPSRPSPSKAAAQSARSAPAKPTAKSAPTQDQLRFSKAIRRVITDLRGKGEHERGWVSVNRVGTVLAERKERRENYGFAKSRPLSTILADLDFKVEQIETGQYRVTLD